jgi:protein-disulfide isomerase
MMAVVLLSACDKSAPGNTNTAPANSASVVKAPAGTDWVSTVVKTPEFGYQMGNPDAKVKLIEYGAFSCPHCAHFTEESDDGLKALVNKGTVSYELRPFLIHPQDLPASMLASCNGPTPFFTIAHQFFATQQTWLANSSKITQADLTAWSQMKENDRAAKMAERLDLIHFVAAMGISEQKAKTCLANPQAIEELRAISDLATKKYQVDSTPTFIINGHKADDTNSWPQVEVLLKAEGA